MKIRNSFVSNSSSSSFILAMPKISVSTILDKLAVPETSPLYQTAVALANFLDSAEELDPVREYYGNFESVIDFAADHNWEVRVGEVSSEEDTDLGEILMDRIVLNIRDKDMILEMDHF